MKSKLSFIYHSLIGRAQLTGFWQFLYKLSLQGLNYGYVGSPEESGEKYVIEFLKKKKPLKGDSYTLVNVGANEGQYYSLFRKLVPNHKAILFEPSNKCYKNLTSLIDIRAQVINKAVGETEGTAELFFSEEGSTQASLLNLGDVKSYKVDVTTLDRELPSDVVVDLMVIDTEGYERNVIAGAKNLLAEGRVQMIQFEHGGSHSVANKTFIKDFFDLLPNYNMYHIKQNGIRKINYSVDKEIFYITNYLAILK